MITIHNANGTLGDADLLRALCDQVEPTVRDRLEEWYEAAGIDLDDVRDEGHATGYAEAQAEGEPYRGAWEDFFNAWHDGYATGRWPGAGPEDEHLRSVMLGDFERGADALAILRDLHEAPELDCLPDTLRRRIETLLTVE